MLRVRHGGSQRWQQRRRNNRYLRPAVLQHVGVVVGGQQRVYRHGHHTGVQAAEERDRPVGAVVHQQQHPFLTADALCGERGSESANPSRELAVGKSLLVVNVGRFIVTARIAQAQVLREIEPLGGGSHRHFVLLVTEWSVPILRIHHARRQLMFAAGCAKMLNNAYCLCAIYCMFDETPDLLPLSMNPDGRNAER